MQVSRAERYYERSRRWPILLRQTLTWPACSIQRPEVALDSGKITKWLVCGAKVFVKVFLLKYFSQEGDGMNIIHTGDNPACGWELFGRAGELNFTTFLKISAAKRQVENT